MRPKITATHTIRTTMTETEILVWIDELETTLAAARAALDTNPNHADRPEVKATFAQIFWCEDQLRAARHALPPRDATDVAIIARAWAREAERLRREERAADIAVGQRRIAR